MQKNVARSNSKILVINAASYIMVIAIWVYHCLHNLCKLSVEFGKEKHFKYIALNQTCRNIGKRSSLISCSKWFNST